VSFCVVIPSARAANLVPCVQSIAGCEPSLPPSAIIAVDDGARVEAEPLLPAITWIAGARPFVFARNVNLGIVAAGGSDVIVMNDDARLITPNGFSRLAEQVRSRPTLTLCSAAIRGIVGNPRQLVAPRPDFRAEPHGLAFICVYLPRLLIERLGLFDERFVGYGFEDNDYCTRAKAAGFQLAIWDGCVVDHSGQVPSTYRTRPDLMVLFEQSRRTYREKWGRDA